MQLVLGEFLRHTRHVLGGPCENVPILTEEIGELASLFAVQVCPDGGKPFWVIRVQRYPLCFFGRLKRTLGITLLGVGGQGRLLAGHGHDSIQYLLLFSNHEGLGQPATSCRTLGGFLVVSGYGDDALGTWYLHLVVGIVGYSHELGQSRSAKQRVVRALQIHYLKPHCLSAEMILVPEEDIYHGLADWGAGQAGYDAMEHSPTGHELLRLDAQLLHGVMV